MVTAKKLTGINPLAYMGVEPSAPPQLVVQPFDPTPADVQNNNIGTLWIVPGTGAVWVLTALSGNTATWTQIYPAVTVPLDFTTDAGVVFPAANNVNVLGGAGIATSGAGDTITIDLDLQFSADAGIAVPAADNINFFGGTNMNTSAAGDAVTINMNTDITVGDLTVNGAVTFTGLASDGVLQADLGGVITASNGTDGQVLIAATAGTPAWANLASGDGSITITDGANTIDLSVTGGAGITTLNGDAGSATGATVTIAGGSNISTSAAASTVTIDLADNVDILGDYETTGGNVILPAVNAAATEGMVILEGGYYGLHTGNAAVNNNAFFGDAGDPAVITTAIGNTGGGAGALDLLTTGQTNTAYGTQALAAVNTGGNNTAVGSLVNRFLTTGSNNISIGYSAATNYTGAESSNIIIGNDGILGESNKIRIGTQGNGVRQQDNTFIAGIFGVTVDVGTGTAVFVDNTGQLGTVVSSRRFKDRITDIGAESEMIYNLRPVHFNMKGTHQKLYGLIAEEVAEVSKDLTISDSNGDPFSVRYEALPALLLNEVQRLQSRIRSLEDRLDTCTKVTMCGSSTCSKGK